MTDDTNVHVNQNTISNIELSTGKDIINYEYGEISNIDKNAERGYCLVKLTCKSYTFRYFLKVG